MSKGRESDKTGRSKKPERYTAIANWIMEKPAWLALDTVARAAYLALKKRYNGENNGRLAFSVKVAAKELNVSPATAMRAFDKLREHGFIARVTEGSFSRKVRHAAEWRLTELTCDVTGEPPTKDFARDPWVSTIPEYEKRERDRKMQNTVRVVKPHGARSEMNGSRGEINKAKIGSTVHVVKPPRPFFAKHGAPSENHIIYQAGVASGASAAAIPPMPERPGEVVTRRARRVVH